MYRNIIDIRREIPRDALKALGAVADNAFDNRAGRVRNASNSPYQFIYEGGEKEYGCLNLGMLLLWEKKEFLSHVLSWKWIDEYEPDENCDVLKELSTPVR